MRKYTFNKLRRLFSCLVIGSLFTLCGCLDTSTPQDKAFENKIIDTLKQDGDTVSVSDIHPGEWTKVCPVIEYDRVSRIAASALKLSSNEQVEIINTNDELASTDQWGYIFLYPPNKVEYLRVSGHFFGSGAENCVPRKAAAFALMHNNGSKRLRLIKNK